ncbi:hypothetical protein Tco_1474765 [Tanacetum coccineum]
MSTVEPSWQALRCPWASFQKHNSNNLIRTDFKQEGVFPEIMHHVFEEFSFCWVDLPFDHEIVRACLGQSGFGASVRFFLREFKCFNTLLWRKKTESLFKQLVHGTAMFEKLDESSYKNRYPKKSTDNLYSSRVMGALHNFRAKLVSSTPLNIFPNGFRHVRIAIIQLWNVAVGALQRPSGNAAVGKGFRYRQEYVVFS